MKRQEARASRVHIRFVDLEQRQVCAAFRCKSASETDRLAALLQDAERRGAPVRLESDADE